MSSLEFLLDVWPATLSPVWAADFSDFSLCRLTRWSLADVMKDLVLEDATENQHFTIDLHSDFSRSSGDPIYAEDFLRSFQYYKQKAIPIIGMQTESSRIIDIQAVSKDRIEGSGDHLSVNTLRNFLRHKIFLLSFQEEWDDPNWSNENLISCGAWAIECFNKEKLVLQVNALTPPSFPGKCPQKESIHFSLFQPSDSITSLKNQPFDLSPPSCFYSEDKTHIQQSFPNHQIIENDPFLVCGLRVADFGLASFLFHVVRHSTFFREVESLAYVSLLPEKAYSALDEFFRGEHSNDNKASIQCHVSDYFPNRLLVEIIRQTLQAQKITFTENVVPYTPYRPLVLQGDREVAFCIRSPHSYDVDTVFGLMEKSRQEYFIPLFFLKTYLLASPRVAQETLNVLQSCGYYGSLWKEFMATP